MKFLLTVLLAFSSCTFSGIAGTVTAWQWDAFGQVDVPANLTNAIAVAAGGNHSLALKSDGTVVGWGDNADGESTPPTGLTNAVAIAAGAYHSLALKADGTVVGWGVNNEGFFGDHQSTPPSGLSNVVAIGAGELHSFAIRQDGSVVGWGNNAEGEIALPAGLHSVVAVAGGATHSLGLLSDGTVMAWGGNNDGQADVPTGLTNVVSIAAGNYHSLAVKSDGTVVAWGYNYYGPTNVPVGLSNVVAVSGGWGFSMALKVDGTVTIWGNNGEGEQNVPAGIHNMAGIASGWFHNLALENTPSPSIVRQPISTTVFDGTRTLLNVGATGNQPLSFQWRFNGTNLPGATDATLVLPAVQATDAGVYAVTISNASGSITSSNAVLAVVQSPPILVNQPTNQIRPAGSNAVLNAAFIGSAPMTYQWRFNGANIDGATNASLILNNLELVNEGNYDVVASNAYGTAGSAVAYLNVVDLAEAVNSTNFTWTTAGDAGWLVETNFTHDKFTAAQSGPIADNQQSTLQTTVIGPGILTFWWVVSSELDSDFLSFSVNGTEMSRLSGEHDWEQQTVYLGSGPQTLQWTYSKNASVGYRRDAGWIDQVDFTPGGTPPELVLYPTNQVVTLSSNTALNASALGTPPLSYQWRLNQTDIEGQTNATLSLTNVQFSAEGNYDVVVSNAFGSAISSNAFVNVVDLTETLDDSNLTWNTGGALPWFIQSAVTQDGVAALQSGNIGDSQQSTLQTTVTGPGTLSFWWKVSSQTNADILNLTINGTEQARISGVVNWQQQTCYLPPGTQTLQWTYSKNVSLRVGLDAGWLDQVLYTPGATVPFITVGPTNLMPVLGRNATFNVTALGTPPLSYQWLLNGTIIPGATNASLVVTNSGFSDQGSYSVTIANTFGESTSTIATLKISPLFAWGAGATSTFTIPTNGQSTIPFGLDNISKIAAGGYHNLVLKNDGRVVAWGANNYSQTNVPALATNIVAVAAGDFHSLAVRSNGTVLAWGNSFYAQTSPPLAASNVISVAAGAYHCLALRSNGTVVAWGAGPVNSSSPHFGQSIVPAGLSNVTAIAAGGYHSLALKSDGTITAWGWNASGQTNVPISLTNVVAIAAGASNSLALKSDGTVVAWGNNTFGQCNVPTGLTNVVAIATGQNHCLALKSDETLVAWGLNNYGQTNVPPELKGTVAISAGGLHNLLLINDGSPIILKQPLNQTAFLGFSATFSVTAMGSQQLSYQWQFNGTNIDGATNQSLTILNATLADAGAYHVQVSNAAGSITSADVTLLVISPLPLFTTQPTNQNVLVKSSAILYAAAASPVPLSYQWRFNGTDIINATNTSLTLTNLQATNSGNYSLLASNAYGVTTSSDAFLNVIDLAGSLDATGLVWTTSGNVLWSPQTTNTHDGIAAAASAGVPLGQVATLQTTVVGPGTLTFWWKVSALVGPNYLYFSVDGTNQNIVAPNTTWRQQTIYLTAGSHTLQWKLQNNSSGSSLSGWVDQVSFVPGATPAIIINAPTNQSLPAGTNVSFSVAAGGTPQLGYQWQFNGANINGATGPYLTLNNIQAVNSGNYNVIVTNAYGSANATVSLTVNPSAPYILIQPTNQQAVVNGNCVFSVSAHGTDPLFYQWQFNGTDISGETNPVLNIISVQTNNVGTYQVIVSNANGSLTSTSATIVLMPNLLIGWGNDFFGQATTPLSISNVTIFRGGWDYSVAVNGNGSILSWGYPETAISPNPSNIVDLAAGLNNYWALQADGTVVGPGVPAGLTNVMQISAGQTFNLALKKDQTVSGWGTSSSGESNFPPGLTNVVSVSAGLVHELALRQDGTMVVWGHSGFDQLKMPPGLTDVVAISAGWYHNLALKRNGTVIAWGWNLFGQTNVPPGLTNVVAIAAGYEQSMALKADGTVVVWGDNSSGQLNVPITVTNVIAISSGNDHLLALVNDGSPYITRPPFSQKALAGQTISLNVAALGMGPLSYQWQFNGSNIPAATNFTLILSNVPVTSAGLYRCTVSNALGTAVSSPALLNVLRPVIQLTVSPHLSNAGLDLQLNGLSGHGPVIIFASSNLLDWQPIYTNPIPSVGTLQFHDTSANNHSIQFYKAVEQ